MFFFVLFFVDRSLTHLLTIFFFFAPSILQFNSFYFHFSFYLFSKYTYTHTYIYIHISLLNIIHNKFVFWSETSSNMHDVKNSWSFFKNLIRITVHVLAFNLKKKKKTFNWNFMNVLSTFNFFFTLFIYLSYFLLC